MERARLKASASSATTAETAAPLSTSQTEGGLTTVPTAEVGTSGKSLALTTLNSSPSWRTFSREISRRQLSVRALEKLHHSHVGSRTYLEDAEINKVAKAAEFPELSKLANSADTDDDGKVSAEEWTELLVKMHRYVGEPTPKTRAVLERIAESAKGQSCQTSRQTLMPERAPMEMAMDEE